MDHMLSATNLGIAAASAAAGYVLYKTLSPPSPKSSIASLRGPKSPSLLMGHMKDLIDPTPELVDDWFSTYGLTLAVITALSVRGVYSADSRVAAYVFANAMSFKKPDLTKAATYKITGPGLFAMEGEVNRKQASFFQWRFGHA